MNNNNFNSQGSHGPLKPWWNKPVSDLVTITQPPISHEQAERDLIFTLLTMAITYEFWNGNMYGEDGNYPLRQKQMNPNGTYKGYGTRYLGHNIACIAVDNDGQIIDFDFNHNAIFNSSAEHAEARLIHRIFSLNRIYDSWNVQTPKNGTSYGNLLNAATLYTSLESCAQCSGIMTLANMSKVVYIQSDISQYSIGNILYNCTRDESIKYGAPIPTPASLVGLTYFDKLNQAYREFQTIQEQRVPGKFFYQALGGSPQWTTSITAFLCTDSAMDIFTDGANKFSNFTPQYSTYKPDVTDAMTNAQVYAHAVQFLAYVKKEGLRGTPHK